MAVLGPESRCALTREVRRLAGEASGGCLGFEGSRPRRPFRLSVRTTAEKRAGLRKGGRGPGKGLSAHAVCVNAAKYLRVSGLGAPETLQRARPTHAPSWWTRGGADVRSAPAVHCGPPGQRSGGTLPAPPHSGRPLSHQRIAATHLPSPCLRPGTSGSGRTGSGFAASCPQGSPC